MRVLHKCLSDLESWLFTVCTISLYSEEITRFLVWSCICKKHYIYLHNVLVTLYIFHFCFYLNYHYPHYNVIDIWYVERFASIMNFSEFHVISFTHLLLNALLLPYAIIILIIFHICYTNNATRISSLLPICNIY